MDILYKLVNGILTPAPSSMQLDDGSLICNFGLVSHEHGFKKLVKNPQPNYDTRYQTLKLYNEETEDSIIEKWEVDDVISLEQYKQQKMDLLNESYNQSLLAGFESMGYSFSYNEEAQKNFTKVTALFAVKPDKPDTPWNTKNRGVVLLTKEQYLQVIEDAENHEWFNIGKLWNYRHKVDIAQSYDEVDAIVWE